MVHKFQVSSMLLAASNVCVCVCVCTGICVKVVYEVYYLSTPLHPSLPNHFNLSRTVELSNKNALEQQNFWTF